MYIVSFPQKGRNMWRTAEHCCICIPGRACVERFVDLHAAPVQSPRHVGLQGLASRLAERPMNEPLLCLKEGVAPLVDSTRLAGL